MGRVGPGGCGGCGSSGCIVGRGLFLFALCGPSRGDCRFFPFCRIMSVDASCRFGLLFRSVLVFLFVPLLFFAVASFCILFSVLVSPALSFVETEVNVLFGLRLGILRALCGALPGCPWEGVPF